MFRANGKKSPSKHGQKGASENNFDQDANESSEQSNPEEKMISKAEIESGNVT